MIKIHLHKEEVKILAWSIIVNEERKAGIVFDSNLDKQSICRKWKQIKMVSSFFTFTLLFRFFLLDVFVAVVVFVMILSWVMLVL
jgi:hypothetical protein